MRTTPDIEDDVLAAAKELARRQGTSAGQVVSRLLRLALSGDGDRGDAGSLLVAGFRPFRAANPKLVTNEQIASCVIKTGSDAVAARPQRDHCPVRSRARNARARSRKTACSGSCPNPLIRTIGR